MLITSEMQVNTFPAGAMNLTSDTCDSTSERSVFQVANEIFTWGDVFVSAKLSGEWVALEKKIAARIACQKKLQNSEEELSQEDFDQACEAFRYEKDLVAAEELEAWLEIRGLSVEQWMEYIERNVLAEQWYDELEDILKEYPPSIDELAQTMKVDGICTGDFQRFAFDLAAQAALCTGSNGAIINQKEIHEFLQCVPLEIRNYSRIEKLAELKLASDRYRREQITENEVLERIQSHSIDYVRFHLQTLTFQNESEALEAALCIREDGESPSSLSAFSGTSFEKCSVYSLELESEIRNEVVSAQAGECIGPLRTSNGEFIVIHIVAKDAPSGDDADLRMRAQESLFQSVRNYEVNQRVRWYVTL